MPIHPEVAQMVNYLNELLKIDPKAISALVNHRYITNQEMVNHKTVQVGLMQGAPCVGMLGVLNGFFGVYDDGKKEGWGGIAALVEKDGTVSSFILMENT